jgi:hypothetical protein
MMKRAILFSLVLGGCTSSSSPSGAVLDAGDAGGDADAAGGMPEGSTMDADVDAGDAGCEPLPDSVGCTKDSDCPPPQPPQNLRRSCCTVLVPRPPTCDFPPITSASCELACPDDTPQQCDATSTGTTYRHLCTSTSECHGTQRCCTLCRGGHSQSVCLLPEDVMRFGADCF